MSSDKTGFFTPEETQEIIQAIVNAEKETSGEIRVHLEQTKNVDSMKRALVVFDMLKMTETKYRNGVLFYVGVVDHQFYIIGDQGINEQVDENYWNDIKDIVVNDFKEGKMKEGLIKGIEKVALKLASLFPPVDNDTDELSNEISGNYGV